MTDRIRYLMKRKCLGLLMLLLLACMLAGCTGGEPGAVSQTVTLSDIPEFDGTPYIAINDNQPFFTAEDMTAEAFETYSELDWLGRCGVVYACIGQELMPTGERGNISHIKPTGWHSVKYDFVDGQSLYNRCHLIGFQLSGENANDRNLITGTRFMNVDGMLPFENMVADYVKETGNHVLYRVTPIFDGEDLVARGVLMEGLSVEDEGDGVCFCVYAYNEQPGVVIDHSTGDSWLDADDNDTDQSADVSYVLNTSSGKFHLPDCTSVGSIKEANRENWQGSRSELIAMGYQPCGACNP